MATIDDSANYWLLLLLLLIHRRALRSVWRTSLPSEAPHLTTVRSSPRVSSKHGV